MSGFGVPVKVESMVELTQSLINIQRSLSDLFQTLVAVSVAGPVGPPGPPGPGGLWFAAQVNSITNRLANVAGVLDVVAVLGVNTNSNAAAGLVGEFISSNVLAGSAVPLVSTVTANVTSIILSAGDWDVGGTVAFTPGGATTMTVLSGGIGVNSATMPTPPGNGAYTTHALPFTTGAVNVFPVGVTRLSLGGTTTVFLVANATFAASTLSAYGFLGARRRR